MNKIAAILVLTGSFVLPLRGASIVDIQEDFATNPSGRWSVFGEPNLFQWDSSAQVMHVTWDSAQTKSLFYIPLGMNLGRYDSFSFEFDLGLQDIVSGNEAGKTGPMQIGIGLLSLDATNSAWSRVEWGSSPDVVEFNTYPDGYYDDFPVLPTTTPSVVGSSGYGYLASLDNFMIALPVATTVHVSISYDAAEQALTALWTTNGVPVGQVHKLVLGSDILLDDEDDFQVNIFSISSYESNEGPYANSVLAHGDVDNVRIQVMPPPPIVSLRGGFNGSLWEMAFRSRLEYKYQLERTENSQAWESVGVEVQGTGTEITLVDTNPPTEKAFYRVRATE